MSDGLFFWNWYSIFILIYEFFLINIHMDKINFLWSFFSIWFGKWICVKGAIFQNMQLSLNFLITSCSVLIVFKVVDTKIVLPIDIYIKRTEFKYLLRVYCKRP